MRRLFAIFAVITVTACTSVSPLDAAFQKMNGKPIAVAIARLGNPDAEQKVMGRTAYSWTTSRQYVSHTPTAFTTNGLVNGRPVASETAREERHASSLTCTIRMIVDDTQIIQTVEYTGNNDACRSHSERLERGG